jgi:ABC-2 type transport system ATP-binding protein
MTVLEYLNFVYDLKKCTLNRKKHIAEICEVIKITDVAGRIIGNLSKGYRQRVGIAQALIGNPEVLIFDEPTVGLDPVQIIEIRNLIKSLGKNHTVILSTHILQEVQAVCDRIIIINKGKIVADESTENITRVVENNRRFSVKICGGQREVLDTLKSIPGVCFAEAQSGRDGEAYTYIVESEMGVDVRKKLFFTLAQKGYAMVGLETLGMSLEDIFISVVDSTERERGAESKRYARKTAQKRGARTRTTLEDDLARELVDKADRKREEAASQPYEE